VLEVTVGFLPASPPQQGWVSKPSWRMLRGIGPEQTRQRPGAWWGQSWWAIAHHRHTAAAGAATSWLLSQ
jgi:hypothetical protein